MNEFATFLWYSFGELQIVNENKISMIRFFMFKLNFKTDKKIIWI